MLGLDPNNIKEFHGSVIGLSSENMNLKDLITLKIIFHMNANTKMIKVKYIVVYTHSYTTLS